MFIDSAIASTAFAQQASNSVQGPSLVENLLPFVFIFVAMYFIMIRPQAKKAKAHSQMLQNMKTGDEVVTSGGIIGRIKSISELFIILEIGNQASLKVEKEHISRLTKEVQRQKTDG